MGSHSPPTCRPTTQRVIVRTPCTRPLARLGLVAKYGTQISRISCVSLTMIGTVHRIVCYRLTKWGHIEQGLRSMLKAGPFRAFNCAPYAISTAVGFVTAVDCILLHGTGCPGSWIVLQLTDSPFMVTAVNAVPMLPILIGSPVGDRNSG